MGKKEMVVLVDEHDKPVGVIPKMEVHGKRTPLHRGFSVFLFDNKGRFLVQRRSRGKKTWPKVWSNSCCGHPLPEEKYEEGVHRRVGEELGCEVENLKKVADYRYRFERYGVVENEICPIFVGKIKGEVKPNKKEVMEVGWYEWRGFLEELMENPGEKWSEWCREEAELVDEMIAELFFSAGR